MAWWPHIVRHLPYFRGYFLLVQKKIQRMYQFFERQIAEHERIMAKSREEGENDKEGEDALDFVSAFFREMKAREGKDNFK